MVRVNVDGQCAREELAKGTCRNFPGVLTEKKLCMSKQVVVIVIRECILDLCLVARQVAVKTTVRLATASRSIDASFLADSFILVISDHKIHSGPQVLFFFLQQEWLVT